MVGEAVNLIKGYSTSSTPQDCECWLQLEERISEQHSGSPAGLCVNQLSSEIKACCVVNKERPMRQI